MSGKAIKYMYCEFLQPLPESFKGSLIECERCREELTVRLPEILHVNNRGEISKQSKAQDRKTVLNERLAKAKDKNKESVRSFGDDVHWFNTSLIVFVGLVVSFYFAFLSPVTAPDSDVLNIGLLSGAERGTMFGLCICLVGFYMRVKK